MAFSAPYGGLMTLDMICEKHRSQMRQQELARQRELRDQIAELYAGDFAFSVSQELPIALESDIQMQIAASYMGEAVPANLAFPVPQQHPFALEGDIQMLIAGPYIGEAVPANLALSVPQQHPLALDGEVQNQMAAPYAGEAIPSNLAFSIPQRHPLAPQSEIPNHIAAPYAGEAVPATIALSLQQQPPTALQGEIQHQIAAPSPGEVQRPTAHRGGAKKGNRQGATRGLRQARYIHIRECCNKRVCVPKCMFQAKFPDLYQKELKKKVVVKASGGATEEMPLLWAYNYKDHVFRGSEKKAQDRMKGRS